MLRVIVKAFSQARFAQSIITNQPLNLIPKLHYHHLAPIQQKHELQTNLCQNPAILQISNNINRPLTKFSLQKGKRKTVKAVLKRFYRLDWGAWIRTKSGRHKKMWKKSESRKRRLREHVFTNGTQSWLLDKMVTKYWRKPKHYVEDAYEPYHTRNEFNITRKRPL